MKKNREQVIAFIQKQKAAFIASIDEDGFPNMREKYGRQMIPCIINKASLTLITPQQADEV